MKCLAKHSLIISAVVLLVAGGLAQAFGSTQAVVRNIDTSQYPKTIVQLLI